MIVGDRVRITEAYGVRFPGSQHHVGRLGTVAPNTNSQAASYTEVHLDDDIFTAGLFLEDEIEVVR